MILVHHIMALVSLATAIDVRAMHAYVLFGLFTEVTTPFVNLRWRLQEAGASGCALYLWNGLAMTAVWGGARVVSASCGGRAGLWDGACRLSGRLVCAPRAPTRLLPDPPPCRS
jgi:hypothetical protein